MSWTGLLSFLFLTAVVTFSLHRMGFRGSDLSRKNNAAGFKYRPKMMWITLTVSQFGIGYIFARKVFPQIFPDWVKTLELGLGVVFFIALAALLFVARKDNRVFQEKLLAKEMLRPKFDDENQKSVRIEGDGKSP
jgi:predicted membrane protein